MKEVFLVFYVSYNPIRIEKVKGVFKKQIKAVEFINANVDPMSWFDTYIEHYEEESEREWKMNNKQIPHYLVRRAKVQ